MKLTLYMAYDSRIVVHDDVYDGDYGKTIILIVTAVDTGVGTST